MDAPQTHEQLIAHNSSLKTRVSELEVINELFRGRLSQLEQQEAAARRGQEVAGVEQSQLRSQLEAANESEAQLRAHLEDSHRRENSLKRRLDDLELELKEAKGAAEAAMERPAKKQRVAEPVKQEELIKAVAAPMDVDPAVVAEVPEAAQVEGPLLDAPEVSVPEATEVVDAAKALEAPEAPQAPEVTDFSAETTEALKSVEAVETTEAPKEDVPPQEAEALASLKLHNEQ